MDLLVLLRIALLAILCSWTKLHAQGVRSALEIPPPPKVEMRAVWIATVAGLDWPKSLDRDEQQRSLRAMIHDVASANFNTIFFQVRSRGDAMYRSRIEPWSHQLTGSLGRDPGWDPLQFVLDEARKLGIEVHAWFNTYFVRAATVPSWSSPPHVIHSHPDWVRPYHNAWWLDPGIPEVQAYLIDVATDLVRSYDIDGIHFDFIRYPGPDFPDESTYRRYGGARPKDEWRRENINTFVRRVYVEVTTMKPWLKVGSAPIGIYVNTPEANGWQSFHTLFQDSRLWMRERRHDYIAPQVYWSLGTRKGDPDFAIIAQDWAENAFGRHVYIGVGAYKPEVLRQIPELIDATRRTRAHGNAFFRYEHISRVWSVGHRYRYPAVVPSMPWKDAIAPLPPKNLVVEERGRGTFVLRWSRPPRASDGEYPRRYVVYRSALHPVDISNPGNIVTITVNDDTTFVDHISQPTSVRHYYAVTALDRLNNESEPTNERSAVISEVVEMEDQIALSTGIGDLDLRGDVSHLLIPYTVAERLPVWLKVLDASGKTVALLVETIHDPGKYVVALNASELREGLYYVQLTAGATSVTKPLTIESSRGGQR